MNRAYLITNFLAAAGIAVTIVGSLAEPFSRNCMSNLESHVVCRSAVRVWVWIDGEQHVRRELGSEAMALIRKRMDQTFRQTEAK